jgi:FkbM family methyltransferase
MPLFIKRFLRAVLPAALTYRLANWVRDRRARHFSTRVIRQSYCGYELSINIADALAEAWYSEAWAVGHVTELMVLQQRKLKPGACVFDIGAHHAVLALVMAKIVGESGTVVAVEADPLNARVAQSNKALNDASNLVVVPAAVSDGKTHTGNDVQGDFDRFYEWGIRKVAFVTMDQLVADHGPPDVVYLDVDGYECKVLAAAQNLLASTADWYVEVHVNIGLEEEGGTWQEVLAHFPESKYELLIASEEQREYRPFSANSPLIKERFFLLALCR